MFDRQFLALCVHAVATAVTVVTLHIAFPYFSICYSYLANLILYAFFAFCTYSLSKRCFCAGKIQPNNKAVFITGCDTGFGNNLARRLDSKGFHVFASCLFPDGEGAAELRKICSDKLQILYLDVTKDESVEKAVNFVKQNLKSAELWAVVNNAGIYKGFFIELAPVDAFREVMEVNSLGQVRVTKAFLPLLRKSKGRVVNVNSIAGRSSLIATCAYSMSKHASLAFTECLSQEMNVWGIPVISVEPEGFRTPMSDIKSLFHTVDEEMKNYSEEILTAYGKDYLKRLKQCISLYASIYPLGFHTVTDTIQSAVMDKYPNHVYKPRWNFITRIVWQFLEIIPYELFEYIQLQSVIILGYPVPESLKKEI